MKLTTPKYLNIGFLLLFTLTFSNCTAWPAVAALLGLVGGKGGGGLMIIPPGGSDATTEPSNSVGGSTGIGFNSSSSTNIETSPNVTIPVIISTSMNATVDYTVTGTATGGGVDYTLANGTLTFTSGGATNQNITFTIVNDALFEANETVIITLSNPTGITLGANTVHTYTIVDDDSASIAFDAVSSSGAEGVTNVTIPVSISDTTGASVNYSVTGGTATDSGTDYTLASGTLTFINGGATTQNITVTVNDDALYENDETIIITLSSPTGANLGINTIHTYTITNDEAPPTVEFTATSSNGFESATSPTMTVTLSAMSALVTTVDYAVSGASSASAGADYTLSAGTLTFPAGTTSLNITPTIVNDLNTELDETLIVILSNATNSTLGNSSHLYTIEDNDAPSISFDTSASVGSEATGSVMIPVSVSAPYSGTVTVDYSVTGGTAIGSGTDYTLASGTLVFASGVSSQNITATIVNDTFLESNETIIVSLSNPTSGSSLGSNTNHTYTIVDEDSASVEFTANASSGSEATTAVTIPVSISQTATASVNYSVTGGTATGSGTDYTLASGTLNFTSGGATTQNVSITINNDTLNEADETIIITLSSPSAGLNLGVNSAHTYTITNDDTAPTVAFSAPTSSGSETVTAVTIPVTLTGNTTAQTVTIGYSVTGGTATGTGTDFTLASGTLTFNPGTTSQNISISVINDSINETNETIQVTLATPTVATLGTDTVHTYTITDNDTAPTVAFSATTSNGSEATTAVTIPVTLTGNATAQAVTVDYSVTSGTATGTGTDYTLASGTLTFNAGTTSQNIDITVVNDLLNETNETIVITLSNPTISTLGTNTAHTYTITDNDTAPTVAFGAATSNSAESVTSVSIPVSLTGNSTAQVVTVDYSISGTATGTGTDFTLAAGTLTFNPGTTSQNIDITVVNDGLNESNETVIITLANPSVATLGGITGHTYTIVDDDTPSIAFNATSSNASETTTAVIIPVTISLTATSSVDYTITGGTATGGGIDFTLAAGTLNFTNGGATSQDINIVINNDALYENDETIVITLSNPSNANLGGNTVHTYTITNDDAMPTVEFTVASQSSVGETGTMTLTAQLSGASGLAVTVPFTVNGSSTATGADYTLSASPISIPAGSTTGTATITITSDAIHEANETVVVDMGSPTNATASGNTTHTATITDDDAAPTVEFTAASQSSAGESGTMTITAQLSAVSGLAVTVPFTVNGSSTATGGGVDYSISALPISIAAGSTTGTITISITTDTLDEVSETVVVDMDTPTNATASGTTTYTATIIDDDAAPTVEFTAASQSSADETGTMTITAQLSAASGKMITIPFTVNASSTATGADYSLSASPISIPAGSTTGIVTITITTDTLNEANEIVVVDMGSPTNATASGTTTHTATITDDDAAPTIEFTAATSNGSESTTAVTIPVNLSTASAQTVTVGYSVTGGTATGADFTLASGTLTYTAGTTIQNISLTIVNDTSTEVDETIIITLASPTNASLGTNTAHSYTINDNDPPTVAFSATASNGSEATGTVTIPVTLSGAYSQAVTVDYSVTGGTASSGGTDFTLAAGTLTFVPGDTSEDITVTVVNDALNEANETIIVTLASPTVASLGTNTAHTYTINDDDTAPTVAFTGVASNGSEATGTVTIPVTLSAVSGQTVTVGYSATGGTATGADFTLASGTLTYIAGVTSQDITITIVNDTSTEVDETIIITLASPTNATLGTNTAHTYTINDNDPPTVAFSATTSNGNEATTTVTIPVTLSGSYSQAVTVDYSVTGGTATGADFTLASGTLTYAAGTISQDITLTVLNDSLDEANETIQVTLASPTVASLGTNITHTYTINDDDTAPTVAFTGVTSNGGEATGTVTIPVTLSAASGQTVTVGYSVTGGTATGTGTDFTLAAGTLTYTAGTTSQDITVAVVNDAVTEVDETIIITLASPTNATLGTNAAHTYTINDNDPPTVAFSTSTSNGSEATTTVTIPVTLSGAYSQAVTVDYSVTGGTATGADYTLAAGTLTYAAGTTSQDITVTVVNDSLDEANETIEVTLATPTVASLGTNTVHTYTINDNDAAPTVAFTTTTGNGSEAMGTVTIPVTLSAASGQTVTVDYSVTGGTATGTGTDFTLASGTLTYTAGTTSQDITVTVVNDTSTEVDETIIITLASPTNATLGTNTAHTYTINDNDPPTVAFSATTSNGSEATTTVTIPVTLSGAYSQVVTVDYSVTGGTATGADFTLTSGTLTFVAGDTSENINVTVVNDTATEVDETIQVTLATPTVASLGTNTVHTYTINDNDPPTVAFGATTSNGSEATTTVTIPVTLSGAYSQVVTVGYSVTGGTATGTGTDFTLASGTLTFVAGDTSEDITVAIVNDALNETNETIVVTLASPTVASLGTNIAHTYTINDDDTPPTLSINNPSVSEGNSGTTTLTYTVTLSAASGNTVSVDYSTSNGTATTADSDYAAIGTATLTFTPGQTSKTIDVTINGDVKDETNETVIVTLVSPSNATIASGTGTGTITNDDTPPTLSISSPSISEGNSGTKNLTYTVTLSAASGNTVTVDYSTADGTATAADSDYSAIGTTTLTFTPGQTSKTIDATINGDAKDEANETFTVSLASPTNASIASGTGTGTITNDDTPPTLSISSPSVSEGNSGAATLIYTVTLSAASGNTVTVDYSTTDGTATTADSDYSAIGTTTLTFTPGQTSKTIDVTVSGDTKYEADETVTVTLANPTNATIVLGTGTGTINNDDTAPTVQFAAVTSSSGNESSTTRTVQVTLSVAAGQDVTVIVTDITGVGAGLATSGTDYTAIGSPLTLTFTAGVTSQNIDIPVIQDLDFEGNETIQMALSSPTNATLGGITGHTFTITEDDAGIISAETMDADNNGKIDHYKITFSEAVTDSTFPGYAVNSLGSSQSNWRVGGTSVGVVLSQGNAEPVLGDTADDAVIYLKFDESGFYDTDSKPEVTTTGNPTLLTASSKTIGNIYTVTVTEADRAKPVVISNSGTTSSPNLTITFSEPVWGAINMPACGSGGELTAATITYTNISGNGASSVTGMGTDSCGSDSTAVYLANTTFLSTDNGSDTVAGNNNLYDAANNSGNTRYIPISVTDPIITSIQQFDTNKNGKIDQLRLTFSISMNDSTITDLDAIRFLVGGAAATKVDTITGGTGIIVSPNTDPGTSNDNIITLFTDDSTVSGTDLKTVSFTSNSGRWVGGNGVNLQTIASLSTVTVDKAPPVILTAVASDNTNLVTGVDSDDTLVLTFSEVTGKPTIDTANISTIFSLNNGHAWGTISSATWNAAGDMLTLVFAGSGSSVAVGDTITILGTVTDTATSPNTSINIPALNPITGTFYTADTSTPTLVSATSINATTVRITYSKAMNVTQATTAGNYKIAASPGTGTCTDNSNFSSTSALSISAVTQVDTKTFDLTTASQSAVTYTVLVNKTGVNDFQPVNLSCPNNADFTGNENIKASAAVCSSTTDIVFTFSKPVKTGINSANSAECNSAVECAKRYYITPATLGTITSVKALDGIICAGAPVNSSKVCISHTTAQGGGNYTVIAANNTDGDGFDNTSWGAIQNSTAPIASLQASPKDRVSFTGCGSGIHNFADGPISTDPFGDNAYFGYVMSYFNKIYVGPNTNGNAASRFNPDGSSPETMAFEFTKDTLTTNSSGTSSNTAATRDGSIAVPPYVTIGHTGCTSNSANIATGCGPNNEDGRGLFASGVIGGTEYLFITGARSGGYDNYLYYTSDTDTVLNFKYLDAEDTINGDGGVQMNKGTESIIVFNSKVYWMAPGNGTYRPYMTKLNNLTQEQLGGTDSVYMQMKFMTGFGYGATSPANNRADNVGGTLFGYNDRIYAANSGSNSAETGTCDAGSSYIAGSTNTINRSGTLQTSVSATGTTTTSGSGTARKTITSINTTSLNLIAGMSVTGTGIAANSTISSFTVGNPGTVVMNNNASAAGTNTITFTNKKAITGLSTTADLSVGMSVTGTGIPAGTTITSIDSSTAITISADSTTSGSQSLTFTSTIAACEQTGGIIRSTNNDPAACTSASTCANWVDITPTTTKFRQYFSIVLLKLYDLIPAERPVPGFESFNSKLYMIRNACSTRVQMSGSSNDIACPSGNEIPQLWKCSVGGDGFCDAGEWSLVAENGSTGKTNMNVSTNKKVSILVKNGSQLYIGYDNATTGVQIWRTKSGVTDPSSESDFEQIGANGLGDASNNLELYSAVSLEQSGSFYVYVTTGRSGSPVQPLRVYRQVNTGPLAFLNPQSMSELLAYINRVDDGHYAKMLIGLILLIGMYFGFRRITRNSKIEN